MLYYDIESEEYKAYEPSSDKEQAQACSVTNPLIIECIWLDSVVVVVVLVVLVVLVVVIELPEVA